MTEIKEIKVTVYEANPYRRLIGQFGFWALLVGAVGVSRVWFGGAVVIDIFALVVALMFMWAIVGESMGTIEHLTREQVIRWALDGAPANIRKWKENQ